MSYTVGRLLFVVLFLVFFRWRVYGRENIPAEGVVICSNHINWLDPPLMASSIKGRKVHFMAKEELFANPVAGFILKKCKAFPVKRDRPDRKALQHSLRLLQEGEIVGMFPEGTRSKTGKMQELMDGAAMLVLKSRAPVVPMAVKGPYRLFQPIEVYLGPPLYFNSDKKGKKYSREDLKEVSRSIRENINKMLEENR